jgi:hypothetical protein
LCARFNMSQPCNPTALGLLYDLMNTAPGHPAKHKA